MEYLPGGGQMKAADQYTIQTLGVPSLELMERAAGECVRFFEEAGLDLSHVCIVCGSGNNGGDGFAIGRILLEKGGVHVHISLSENVLGIYLTFDDNKKAPAGKIPAVAF